MPASTPELRSCSNCKYYFAATATEGQCRRRPPVLLLTVEGNRATHWPDVMPNQWCGEHHSGVKSGEVKIGRPATRHESLDQDALRFRALLPDATTLSKAFTARHVHDLAMASGWTVAISRVSDVMRHLELDGRAMSIRLIGTPTAFYFRDVETDETD